ncbi:MAG: adenylyl-sulfate kinase [Oceanipulchritudo sp.]
MENIHPEFHRMLGREAKEALLRQRGMVFWLYGLSGSGKSTIANALERKLHAEGFLTQILDGDNIRTGLNANLGFTDEDRAENIRRIAEVARLYLDSGLITLTSFICPTRELRQLARSIIGPDDFVEVFVRASFETCARRDPKGLYAKARAGKIPNFTGKDSAFEEPAPGDPVLLLDTESTPLEDCVQRLFTIHQKRLNEHLTRGREVAGTQLNGP